jgi:hypothetical protein
MSFTECTDSSVEVCETKFCGIIDQFIFILHGPHYILYTQFENLT